MGGSDSLGEFAPWTLTSQQVARELGTDITHGLTSSQVAEQREKHGYNELEKEPPTPLWKLVLEQFDDMLVKVRFMLGRRMGPHPGH